MEIEKKYLTNDCPYDLEKLDRHVIEQAYLCGNPTVRIRRLDDRYILTYKRKEKDGGAGACVSEEVELPLNREAYEHLLEKKDSNVVRKTRYIIPLDRDHKIELDVFEGKLRGLVMAEVEFLSLDDAKRFKAPGWFKKEVSGDQRFSNRYLSTLEKYDIEA